MINVNIGNQKYNYLTLCLKKWVIPENIHTVHGGHLGIPREKGWGGGGWTGILKAWGSYAAWASKHWKGFSSKFPERKIAKPLFEIVNLLTFLVFKLSSMS